MTAFERVISRLCDLEFRIQKDHLELFGETLPLLKAIAVDGKAHQLVLIAEQETPPNKEIVGPDGEYDQPWRELLFAVSGLRHHLRGSGHPALGSPILIAIVDTAGAERLQGLAEKIAADYALFSRLDINIVDVAVAGHPDALDHALAPLLPRTREAIKGGITVASQDVEQFWDELSGEIRRAAGKLRKHFDESVTSAMADRVIEEIRVSADGERPPEDFRRRPPSPISSLGLENFRSFGEAEFPLAPATIVHGANGSGKTSVCEALEILWSGWTQRIPDDVTTKDYARHLNHEGRPFSLTGRFAGDDEPKLVSEVAEKAGIPIGRTVLAQHTLDVMASGAPKDRFKAFLTVSGLDLPELDARVGELRKAAYEEANNALEEAGVARMRTVARKAVDHLDEALKSNFAATLLSPEQLEGAVESLRRVADGAYKLKRAPLDPALPELLVGVDAALAGVRRDLENAPDPAPRIEVALISLRDSAANLRKLADPLRQLAGELSLSLSRGRQAEKASKDAPSPVPPPVAARWLSHVRGIEQSIPGLERMSSSIEDVDWTRRLDAYIESLRAAVRHSSVERLEGLRRPPEQEERPHTDTVSPSVELLSAAGFSQAPVLSRDVVAAMGELSIQLANYAASLDELAASIERHPGPSLLSRAARLMPALCRCELTRELARPGGAVKRTRETLVTRLLDRRLTPVVCELVAALVRFEWYFEPLRIDVDGDRLRMSKLATADPDLDVRLLLNAAERTVVGIAWFLTLHALQRKEERRALVLDDPTSGFDAMNKAAFVATLRSILHLLKPEQFLITTHDDALVAVLEQELAPVEGWPRGFDVLRCRRTETRASEIEPRGEEEPFRVDLDRELSALSIEPSHSKSPAGALQVHPEAPLH